MTDWRRDLPPLSDEFHAQYRIEGLLGEGGMGAVYRAHQVTLGRAVAVKLLKGYGDVDAARFAREGRVLASLRHPAVLAAYDFGVDGIVPYLVCELLDGETLHAVIKRERLNLGRSLVVLREMAAALAYAHSEGVVHRDVKPENVFILGDGSIKLTDFGLARETAEGHTVTQAGMLLGTPGYVAPEQMQGTRPAAPTDQYALGVVAFELITGALPFQGPTPAEVAFARLKHDAPRLSERCADLPAAVDELVARALQRKPEDRFGSMAEFGAAIEAVRAGLGEAGTRTYRVVVKTSRGTPVHGTPSIVGSGRHRRPTPAHGTARTASMEHVPRDEAPAERTRSMDHVPDAARPKRTTVTVPVVSHGRLGAAAVGMMVVTALVVGTVTLRFYGPAKPMPSPEVSAPASLPPRIVPSVATVPLWMELRVAQAGEGIEERLTRWEPLAVFDKRVALGNDRDTVAADLREAARALLAELQALPRVVAAGRGLEAALKRYAAVVRLRQVNHLCRVLKLPLLDLRGVQVPGLNPDPPRSTNPLVLADGATSLLAAGQLAGEAFYDSPSDAVLGLPPLASHCGAMYLRFQAVSMGEMNDADLYVLHLDSGGVKRALWLERAADASHSRNLLTHAVPRELLMGRWKLSARVVRPAGLGIKSASSEVAFQEVEVRGDIAAKDWVPSLKPGAIPLAGCWMLQTGTRKYAFRLQDAGQGRYTGALCPAARGTAEAWFMESGRVFVHLRYLPTVDEHRATAKDVIAELDWANGRAQGPWLGYLMTGQSAQAELSPGSCEECK